MENDALYESRDGYPSDNDTNVFIQWKGTDVCLDFHCSCGQSHHIDAYFVYNIQCTCGKIWEMPHSFHLIEVENPRTSVHICTREEDFETILNPSVLRP